MKMLIFENFKLGKTIFKTKDNREIPIIKLKATDDDAKNLMFNDNVKKILNANGAKYNPVVKTYFWFEDQTSIDKIKKTIAEINKYLSVDGEESKKRLITDIDELIRTIETEDITQNPELNFTEDDKEILKKRLDAFRNMLVNIKDDSEFKDVMRKLIDIRAAQGKSFSFANTVLIFLQNPKAKQVYGKIDWADKYNRTVNPNAKPIAIWAPEGKKLFKSKEQIEKEKEDFFKKINKTKRDDLTPNEKFKLDAITKGSVMALKFKLVAVYNISDTKPMEGKTDYIKSAEEASKNIKWFEENMISDDVRPIYKALLDFCEENNIKTELVDDLDGSRGVSASGLIKILKNEGNDVGLTKTLAHEITHELLHQNYLASKGGESGSFYIGRLSRDVVEQQAELSAWMFMYAFGFDLKTTSLNYTVLWGADEKNMVKVFETVSRVVNFLTDYVNKKMKIIDESMGSHSHGSKITPNDIAKVLGFEKEFNELSKEELMERIIKKLRLI